MVCVATTARVAATVSGCAMTAGVVLVGCRSGVAGGIVGSRLSIRYGMVTRRILLGVLGGGVDDLRVVGGLGGVVGRAMRVSPLAMVVRRLARDVVGGHG